MTSVRLRDVGPSALLVEVDDALAAAVLAERLRAVLDSALPGHRLDVVPAACTVLVDGLDERARAVLRPVLDGAGAAGHEAVPTRAPAEVEVPVRYDGADLEAVARAWGTDVDAVVAEHTATTFTSAFCGFAPGFAYLAGLPGHRAVPRLAEPRARVPAGSVALADRWCGVYPTASPGGWLLLGRTEVVLWDVARVRPALLEPGTRVRFVAQP